MNVDFTREELAQLVDLIKMQGGELDPLTKGIHAKVTQCLSNFSVSDTPLEPNPDPRAASQQWKSPI